MVPFWLATSSCCAFSGRVETTACLRQSWPRPCPSQVRGASRGAARRAPLGGRPVEREHKLRRRGHALDRDDGRRAASVRICRALSSHWGLRSGRAVRRENKSRHGESRQWIQQKGNMGAETSIIATQASVRFLAFASRNRTGRKPPNSVLGHRPPSYPEADLPRICEESGACMAVMSALIHCLLRAVRQKTPNPVFGRW